MATAKRIQVSSEVWEELSGLKGEEQTFDELGLVERRRNVPRSYKQRTWVSVFVSFSSSRTSLNSCSHLFLFFRSLVFRLLHINGKEFPGNVAERFRFLQV